MKDIIINIEDNKLLLRIDSSIFEKEALLQASYKFTSQCYINIENVNNCFEVLFQPFENQDSSINLKDIALKFGNEIIDQQIRLQTGREFKGVREILVRKAFSSISQ